MRVAIRCGSPSPSRIASSVLCMRQANLATTAIISPRPTGPGEVLTVYDVLHESAPGIASKCAHSPAGTDGAKSSNLEHAFGVRNLLVDESVPDWRAANYGRYLTGNAIAGGIAWKSL